MGGGPDGMNNKRNKFLYRILTERLFFNEQNNTKVQNYTHLLVKKKRLKPKLSILSTDNTRTSHSSGSVAQEAHVPITTFVVVLIHADERAPQLRASPHPVHLTLPLILT